MNDFSIRPDHGAARRRKMTLMLLREVDSDTAANQASPVHCNPACQNEGVSPAAVSFEPFADDVLRKSRLTWLFTGDSLSKAGQDQVTGAGLVSSSVRVLRDRFHRTRDAYISTECSQFDIQLLTSEFEERVARFHPDIVILTFGLHELQATGESSLAYERRLMQLMEKLRSLKARVLVNLPPLFPGNRAPVSADQLIRLEAIRACTIESSLLLADHWSHWEQHAESSWVTAGGDSLSEKGAAEMTRLMLGELDLIEYDAGRETKVPVETVDQLHS
ncbi:SGNH/GDSL hydrolase family protein [Planctomicrobium sp. SH661]|uniref:SGNH/GDSL hydrolase family protein n=1 Tax=Planctomicrobium sp. SH661 TaxID=3448124 RepID=UPI003F5B257C